MGGDDSRVDPRHTGKTAAVASFRTWRDSQSAVARGPAIISAHKPTSVIWLGRVVWNKHYTAQSYKKPDTIQTEVTPRGM